jgi:hypothetical protein
MSPSKDHFFHLCVDRKHRVFVEGLELLAIWAGVLDSFMEILSRLVALPSYFRIILSN